MTLPRCDRMSQTRDHFALESGRSWLQYRETMIEVPVKCFVSGKRRIGIELCKKVFKSLADKRRKVGPVVALSRTH